MKNNLMNFEEIKSISRQNLEVTAFQNSKVDLWAGVECTVNRVGDRYFDQLQRNGHAKRPEDLKLFANLGIRTMRYPILWERTAPNGLESADWSWADERLGQMRSLGIRPIIGLVHHGSGPPHTSLVDPAFAPQLAQFAGAFAERYPWVSHYTPVNEPLTTARFSGLYGHWYPHGRDGQTFAKALLIQCRAIALSMQAIRRVNPAAKLVQTEDLGKVFSTPTMAYQAEFENERRWLSFDLLCGRVNRDHPMWGYQRWLGISERELEELLAEPCEPDIIGINHYLTSDRFLDERVERYPTWSHGGNGRHHYADIEAVRVCADGLPGLQALLKEGWERYGKAIAITEAHLGSTREEQLRWLNEVWEAATNSRHEGVDVRAVTAWSLLGAYDWNSLVTRADGHYESGVFDLRSRSVSGGESPQPRPTALAQMLQAIAQSQVYDHPVLDVPGWWHRPGRLLYPPVHFGLGNHTKQNPASAVRPLAIIGATGTLGSAFARVCDLRGIPYHLLTRQDVDITNPAQVDVVLSELQPWAVVNAAGYVRVDDAEQEPDACFKANAQGPAILAAACQKHSVALLTFSSDLVFDGAQSTPYVESDIVAPLNVYGRSKALAEAQVMAAHGSSLVIRTSAFFGPWDEYNFITIALRQLAAGQTFTAVSDGIVSPTYVPDLVNTSLDLLIDGEHGLWHLANQSAISWADLARFAAKSAGLDATRIRAVSTKSLMPAPRPAYSVLGSERGLLLPDLESAIARYLRDRPLQTIHKHLSSIL